jgi:hypothetical protein
MNRKRVMDLKNELIERIKHNQNIECEEILILVMYLFEKLNDIEENMEKIEDERKRGNKDYKNLLEYLR